MNQPIKLPARVIKHWFTLNDNKTFDLGAALFTLIVVVACLVFGCRAFIKDEKPDYLNFLGGLGTLTAAFGFSRNNRFGDPDTTKTPKETTT